MSDLLAALNAAQNAAATAGAGPLAIVAGPGTGKTKTLTARLEYLLGHAHVPPAQILALTFTNKAARELQARVGALIGEGVGMPLVTTFHSLCYDLLRGRGDAGPRIIAEPERLELLRDLRRRTLAALPLRELIARLSRLKNLPSDQLKLAGDAEMISLLHAYDAALRTQNLLDFDDLLRQTYDLLVQDADFRAAIQSRWQHILVDEFQDTNELQYQLLRLLAAHDNYFVIGDPLQSIYGFRGATGDIFRRFGEDFPQARQFTLTANYRFARPVVALANAVFAKAPPLTAIQTIAGSTEVVQTLNEYREAGWIVRTIEQDLGGTDFQRSHHVQSGMSQAQPSRKFGDYAVLYRTHRVAQAFKRVIAESGIPYQCVGDDSPYASKPMRSAIAAMRLATRPSEALAPADARLLRSVPRSTLAQLSSRTVLPPTHFLALAARKLCLIADDGVAKQRTFNQVLGSLARFDNLPLDSFLVRFQELTEQEFYDPQADAVTLLTIHAAKGLEFAHVFLLAAEDRILPHRRDDVTRQTEAELAEEQRLFYVAVTRARERLTILHTRTRGGQPTQLSPFVQAIDERLLPRALDGKFATQARSQMRRAHKNAQLGLF